MTDQQPPPGYTDEYHYLYADAGLFAIYVKEGGGGRLCYTRTDHLGSLKTVLDVSRQRMYNYSYDAWGKPRDPYYPAYAFGGLLFAERGFGGHEHLPRVFGLIDMNGRMYDPELGRFLSPDPYVQAPDFSQNFNRYSYCLNNPLRYVDPSGESIIAAMIIGAFINGVIQDMSGNINSFGDFTKAVGIGALSGLAGAGAGSAVSGAIGVGGFLGGAASGGAGGFAGGFVGGAGNAWSNGASFGDGLLSGLKTGGMGALTGGVIGGLSGGIQAYRNDLNIWNGSSVSEHLNGGQVHSDGKKLAASYNRDISSEGNDVALRMRIKDQFKVKVGDYGLQNITTKTGGYGMTSDGAYVNSDGNTIGGYVRSNYKGTKIKMHISPKYARADNVNFRAIVGHELRHVYHRNTLSFSYNRTYSEMSAYKYSVDTYLNAGYFRESSLMMWTAILKGYWATPPALYNIPSFLPF